MHAKIFVRLYEAVYYYQLFQLRTFYLVPRHFSPHCTACLQVILPTHLVRFAGNMAFHASCFKCAICSHPLATGDGCRLLGNGQSVVCLQHNQHQSFEQPPQTPSCDDKKQSEELYSISKGSLASPFMSAVFQYGSMPGKQESK